MGRMGDTVVVDGMDVLTRDGRFAVAVSTASTSSTRSTADTPIRSHAFFAAARI
jgi:hypothetical protein